MNEFLKKCKRVLWLSKHNCLVIFLQNNHLTLRIRMTFLNRGINKFPALIHNRKPSLNQNSCLLGTQAESPYFSIPRSQNNNHADSSSLK
ncbi:MAG: hypothetical protein EBQ87_12605 [Planctomycetes bacterium]|nr:hypothetical protein [Planctomycetota bacterium]